MCCVDDQTAAVASMERTVGVKRPTQGNKTYEESRRGRAPPEPVRVTSPPAIVLSL
ncbi:hypothetical protein PanWU01x14_325320 [Parasponia andersonii]|uniref:Uncharacterized protein n=1 Tax=Parasponia andersonii TaxID=3476 RepID=A0A2P5AJW3_PARAD|nr:hypothetical protein PanWU01x14_325320 [Parasponia andersonii]